MYIKNNYLGENNMFSLVAYYKNYNNLYFIHYIVDYLIIVIYCLYESIRLKYFDIIHKLD